MHMFYCFTVAIGLSDDASNYNKDKTSAIATRIQNKVVVEWGSNENKEWDFGYLGRTKAVVRR